MIEQVTTDRFGLLQHKLMNALGLGFSKETDCESLRTSVATCLEVAEMFSGTPYARRSMRIAYSAQKRIEELGCIEPVVLTRRATDPQPEL